MYGFKIRYLASVYLDIDSLVPEKSLISDLLTSLDDERFFSLQVLEMPDVPGGSPKPRIGLSNQKDGYDLVLLGKRFNFVMAPLPPDGKNMVELDKFCSEAAEKLNAVLKCLGRRAKRLALVREGFLPKMEPKQMDKICKHLLTLPKTFSDKTPFEWDCRAASRISRNFAGRTEDTNTLVTIKRFKGNLVEPSGKETKIDQIRVDLDINTSPENIKERFGETEIGAFFCEVVKWQKELEEEVLVFLKECGYVS
jgi:hypothetical protein